ncbi:class I SAM-dependent methyltransferase [Bacteroidota bacterium]
MNSHTSPDDLLINKVTVPNEFDKIARYYNLATFLNQGYQKDLQRSVNRMQLKGDEYVADLCCGTGKSTFSCLKNLLDGKVVGIDNSEEMLHVARSKYATTDSSGKIKFMKMDVMNLDFPNKNLDAIFMAYGIRNMPDYKKCLKNLYRVIKPGGKICFHEYSLKEKFLYKLYWKFIGYVIVIPFSTVITRNTSIFRYLVKSVLEFPSPSKFLALLNEIGFENCKRLPQKSWRRPILHTFVATKPIT